MNVLPACMHMYHVYVVPPKDRRVLLELELQQLWTTMKMLWAESRSSTRTTSALSTETSLQPNFLILGTPLSWLPALLPAPCLSSSDTVFLTDALTGPVLAPGPRQSISSYGFHHCLPYWIFFQAWVCSCNVLLAIVTWNVVCLG